MFKIGDFSKLSRVTVKTLRFYDELGLIKPAKVDDFSGYRYYTADQLPVINRILALKDLGLSLDEIGKLLERGLSSERFRTVLERKQDEIEGRLRTDRELLSRVEARLKQLEQEEKMSAYEVVVKKVEPLRVASIRQVIENYSAVGQLYGELFGYLGRNRAQPTGPAMAIWHDQEYKEKDVDGEAAVPVGPSVQGNERVKVQDMPAVATMACTVHKGSYQNLNQAYSAIMSWIGANGYQIAGPNREVYLYCGNGPARQDDESYVTEIQFPVRKG